VHSPFGHHPAHGFLKSFFVELEYFSLQSEMSLILKSLFFLRGFMSRTCKHCGELIVGNAYRVTSEEDGMILLNMIVCSLCAMEAKRLRLHTEEIDVRGHHPSVRNRGSRRSRFGA
jgi:RNase P subunit RPR2